MLFHLLLLLQLMLPPVAEARTAIDCREPQIYSLFPSPTRFIITIYAPMIYTAPCIMFWMRAYPLQGKVGGGWALEFSSFLGPVKW